MLLVVAELHLLERDRGLRLGDRDRAGRVADIVLAVEHFEATLRPGGRAFHRPGRVGERLERLIEHEKVGAENEERAEGERAGEDMQRAEVVHRRGADDHERADDERAFHIREGELQVGLHALLRALMKLRDLEVLAPKRGHHPDRAQAFLGLGQNRAFLFLDVGRFRPDPVGEEIDRTNDEGDDA